MINYLVKKILFKRNVGTLIASLWVLFSFIIEYITQDNPLFQNVFSSSGAILTIVGLFLTIKATTIFHIESEEKDKEKNEIDVLKKKTNRIGGNPPQCTPEFPKEVMQKYIQPIEKDEVRGFILIVIGTLLWGYGSFLFFLLNKIINCFISIF